MSDSPAGHKVVNAHMTPLLPYDMEGPVQPEGCLIAVFEWVKVDQGASGR
jgi:hypothetical protein